RFVPSSQLHKARRCTCGLPAAACWSPARSESGGEAARTQRIEDLPRRVRAVERVEVNARHPTCEQAAAQLDGRTHADFAYLFRVVLALLELRQELTRNAGAAHAGEALDLRHVGDRHDAGDDGHVDAPSASLLNEGKIRISVEEQLRNQEVGASVDLELQRIQILLEARRFRMRLGIAGTGNAKLVVLAGEGHEFARMSKTAHGGLEACRSLRRITAQGDDVVDAGGARRSEHWAELGSRRANAGQVRQRLEAELVLDATHQLDREFARGAASAIGDGNVARSVVTQLRQGLEELRH